MTFATSGQRMKLRFFGGEDLPLLDDVPTTIQERGWTSPIWYTPAGS